MENANSPSIDPPARNDTSPVTSNHSDLCSKSIAGIVAGCALAVLFLLIAAGYLIAKRRRRSQSEPPELDSNDTEKQNVHYNFVSELGGATRSAELRDPRSWLEMDVSKRMVEPEAPSQHKNCPRTPYSGLGPQKLIVGCLVTCLATASFDRTHSWHLVAKVE